MISPRAVPEGAGYVSESSSMLARDDLGTKVLLLFLPGSGMLPEIKFFSLGCVLPSSARVLFSELRSCRISLVPWVHCPWWGPRADARQACLGSFPSSSTNQLGNRLHLYALHSPICSTGMPPSWGYCKDDRECFHTERCVAQEPECEVRQPELCPGSSNFQPSDLCK